MRIVIDANRIVAALIKDSTTRDILFDINFEFVAPDYLISELRKCENEIKRKAKLAYEEFEILLALIFERITIIPGSEYNKLTQKLKYEISDINDIPYIAVCLMSNANGIWTHDPHFMEQRKVNIFTNIDMLRLIGKAKSD